MADNDEDRRREAEARRILELSADSDRREAERKDAEQRAAEAERRAKLNVGPPRRNPTPDD